MIMRKFKKILVFPDFCSSGLWDGSDKHHVMIEYEDLGLSRKLIKEFKHWVNDMYDAGYRHRNYDGLRKKAVMPVYREGLRLAGEIKKLVPKTEVEYWGELYRCELKKVKINRSFGSLRSTVKIDGTLADPFIHSANKVLSKAYIPEELKKKYLITVDQKAGKFRVKK